MMKPYAVLTLCNHPEGIKPTCACGANASCPICGYGHGQYPCDCTRNRIVKEAVDKYKKQFSQAWIELAKN
jgi:citrate synthase